MIKSPISLLTEGLELINENARAMPVRDSHRFIGASRINDNLVINPTNGIQAIRQVLRFVFRKNDRADHYFFFNLRGLIGWHGLPVQTIQGGTSFVTTDTAPILVPSPIVTQG